LSKGGGDVYETIEGHVMRTGFEYCHRNQLETAGMLGISRNIVRARLLQCGELTGKRRTRDAFGMAGPSRAGRSNSHLGGKG